MKVELSTTLAGTFSLECITETDFEYGILERAWASRGYERGNGKSTAPNGGSTGFYIPLFSEIEKLP
jgi:hypothetical protein